MPVNAFTTVDLVYEKGDALSNMVKEAGERLNMLNLSAEDRKSYEKHLMNIASERNVMNTGRKEGREEKAASVAKNMLLDQKPLEEIVKAIKKQVINGPINQLTKHFLGCGRSPL